MAGRGSAPGERRGGRKKGTPNRATPEKRAAVAAVLASGKDPLEIILQRMNDPASISEAQFIAACAAAPYVHPRLSSAAVTVKDPFAGMTRDDIDRYIAQFAGRHLAGVAAAAADGGEGEDLPGEPLA